MKEMPALAARWLLRISIGLAFLISLLFRLISLNNIPGINGDEAWYGIQATNILHSRAFEWLAPSGRPLVNPFFLLPEIILHLFFDPAFWILRFPSVVAGLCAVFLSYHLFRDLIGRPAALSLSLLTATLPINIAYSRFGWDPSLVLLCTIVIFYFALRDNRRGIILSFLAGLLVHPSVLLLAPLIIMMALSRQESAILPQGKGRTTGALLLIGCIFLAMYAGNGRAVTKNLLDFSAAGTFLSHIPDLFTGETAFRYIVDEHASVPVAMPFLFGAVLALSLWGAWRASSSEQRKEALLHGTGLCLSTLSGYLLFGALMVLPHTERYAIYLIFPVTLLFVKVLYAAVGPTQREWLATTVVLLLSLYFLSGFYQNFFLFFQKTGGNSHVAFRTGELDPKQVAYLSIRDDAAGRPVRIFAHSYWLAMPMRYLASGEDPVQVVELPDLWTSPRQGDYVVTFAGGGADVAVRQVPGAYQKRWVVLDYASREFLVVYRL